MLAALSINEDGKIVIETQVLHLHWHYRSYICAIISSIHVYYFHWFPPKDFSVIMLHLVRANSHYLRKKQGRFKAVLGEILAQAEGVLFTQYKAKLIS